MAKMEKYGGNPYCVISEPEIHVVKIDEATDFILIASDGIFDRIDTPHCVKVIMDKVKEKTQVLEPTAKRN